MPVTITDEEVKKGLALFIGDGIAAELLALVALELLVQVKEVGEVEKGLVRRIMRHSLKSRIRDFFVIDTFFSWHERLWETIRKRFKQTGDGMNEKKQTEVT